MATAVRTGALAGAREDLSLAISDKATRESALLRRSNFRDDWTAARTKARVSGDVHFHDLRHTGDTLASSAGASTRELMTRMRHSTTRAALIYQHMTSDRDQHIAGKLGEMIRQAREKGPGT
ncbi:tyrosine-type recombinase/integrase [Streptomyces sp. NPDC091368]|uniref:tyrosine-type recombinase/integrase n=1 Tax=Streptomyces sp. NPDC091368 TaxID=3365993 RepID=UPI0038165DB8